MAARGQTMVEETVFKTTPVTIEFNISKTVTTFNILETTINLLKELFRSDTSLRVKSRHDDTTWGPQDDFPENEEFHKHFITREVSSEYANRNVYVCVTIISPEEIDRLKWRPNVRDYTHNHIIWVK